MPGGAAPTGRRRATQQRDVVELHGRVSHWPDRAHRPAGLQAMTINRGYAYRDRIGPDAIGMTVLAYLSTRHRHSSRGQWCERLDRGELTLDGRTLRADVSLRAGGTLVWHR